MESNEERVTKKKKEKKLKSWLQLFSEQENVERMGLLLETNGIRITDKVEPLNPRFVSSLPRRARRSTTKKNFCKCLGNTWMLSGST